METFHSSRYRSLPLKGTERYPILQGVDLEKARAAMNPSGQSASEPRRLRRDAAELRAAIIEAAAEVFFEQGYESASIEAVIERVGGSKRAIYSHFGGKKELFAALVTETSNKVLDGVLPDGISSLDLEGTLFAFGQRYMQVVRSEERRVGKDGRSWRMEY